MFVSADFYQDIYKKGMNVDLAIAGVGNPIESSTYKQLNYFDDIEVNMLSESSSVGDILASFFDRNGQVVNNSISERMLGISLIDLMRVKSVLVFSTGLEKREY